MEVKVEYEYSKLEQASNKESPEEEEKPAVSAEKEEVPSISYFELFRYSSGLDKCLFFFGILFALAAAACMTGMSWTLGTATGVIVDYVYTSHINGTDPAIMEEAARILEQGMIRFVIYSTSLGVIILTATYLTTVMLNYSALRQTFKIRQLFFSKVLNQDISWFDQNQTGDFSSRMADDLQKVEDGMGEKIGVFIFYEGIFLTSVIQGLVKGWQLALICMASFPISTISMGLIAWLSSKFAKEETEAYGEAGALAEETLTSIRTVVAFGGQTKEVDRYDGYLLFARNNNVRKALLNGLSNGVMWFFTYGSYSLAFWYGVKLIIADRGKPPEERTYDAGNFITIFFSILFGVWYFGMATGFVEIFGVARGAAAKIFYVIASEPTINASKGKGKTPSRVNGKITFQNVHFTYPSRKDVTILNGLNLTINSGETVALVGSSGCGKTTCMQLSQRFYDPDSGCIYIDDNKLTDLDLSWIRSFIGVVGQEPVLFEGTITDNIKYGSQSASKEEIEEAAKKANAHSFITALPQGYATVIGERGTQLSGGQKQRIAIARAVVRKPAILLLDEATSALDSKSEAIVQEALDAVSYGCTTIIVAHRLSAVRNADRIIVLADGVVKEEGTHEYLMNAKGAYFDLVTAQVVIAEKDQHEDSIAGGDTNDGVESSGVIVGKEALLISADETDIIQTSESGSSLWAIMKYNVPEWWAIVLGCLSSVVNGATMPVYSILFGALIGILANNDDEMLKLDANRFAIYFLIIGVVSGVFILLQHYAFGVAAENLTMRLRSLMFRSMLNQEMGWYDKKENGVGALCATLSGEAASVQGATGPRIGTVLNSVTTIVIALVVAFYYEWRLAFTSLAFAPLILLTTYLEHRITTGDNERQSTATKNSSKIAVEAINGIRTVASLGCEEVFQDRYLDQLLPYQNAVKRNVHYKGLICGFSRNLMCFIYPTALYYGAQLVKNEGLNYAAVFIVCETLISSCWSLATALTFAPNLTKGLVAANRIFSVINRSPNIVDGSDNIKDRWVTGNVHYKNVRFAYPNRPSAEVLKGFDLSILTGKTVALVGPSGCGKSTVIQLLERFYDPTSGDITAGERGIRKMNLMALRSQLGIVSQEPNLFTKTIAENIAYGDNTREVTKEEIISAATQANIHSFITSLPLGYQTKLGEKGTQLSGGQKQRVAIARALVSNPKVLLLDEATSALDAESEKAVQEALDTAKIGRTCISIAHRLSTIQDADIICVMDQGVIAEMGTHAELLNKKGLYYNLYSLQN